jgi:hypothetical protein
MSLRHILVAAAFALSSVAVHAETFAFNAIFDSTSGIPRTDVATGTIMIDTTSGQVTAVDVTVTGHQSGYNLGSVVYGGAGFVLEQEADAYSGPNPIPNPPVYYSVIVFEPGSDYSLQLVFPVSSLVGYGGGEPCIYEEKNCPTYFGATGSVLLIDVGYGVGADELAYSASLQPVADVPEAPTFILLGTGVLGLVGEIKRRCWLG